MSGSVSAARASLGEEDSRCVEPRSSSRRRSATASDLVGSTRAPRESDARSRGRSGRRSSTEPRNPTAGRRPAVPALRRHALGYKNFAILARALVERRTSTISAWYLPGRAARREGAEEPRRGPRQRGSARSRPVADGQGAPRLYDGAPALVVTSRCEGFGLPLARGDGPRVPGRVRGGRLDGGSRGRPCCDVPARLPERAPRRSVRRWRVPALREQPGCTRGDTTGATTAGAYIEAYHAIRSTPKRRRGQMLRSPTLRKTA